MQNQRQADLWKILQSTVRFRLVLTSNGSLGCAVDRIFLAFLLIFFYSQKQRGQDSRRISSGSCTSLSSPDISWYCTSCLLFLFFVGYICSSRLARTMKLCTRCGPSGLSNTRKPQSDWICMVLLLTEHPSTGRLLTYIHHFYILEYKLLIVT